jgi:hypothetical protein
MKEQALPTIGALYAKVKKDDIFLTTPLTLPS